MTDRREGDASRMGASPDPANELYPAPPDDMLDDPELELITDYLTGQLPPEQVAEVKRRLEEDEAFRELAAPLVLAWSVPPRWQREPMPRAELLKHWDDFTRRAGFVHQRERRKARRRRLLWLTGAVVALAVVIAPWLYTPAPTPEAEWPEFVPVVDSGGWMSLGPARVRLEPGGRLLKATAPFGHVDLVQLEGSAQFAYARGPRTSHLSDSAAFSVLTKSGVALTIRAHFRVTATSDATEVEVLEWDQAIKTERPSERDLVAQMPDHVSLAGRHPPTPARVLTAGEVGRVRRGISRPVAVREVAEDPPFKSNLIYWLMRNLPR